MDDSDLSSQERSSLKAVKVIGPVKTRCNFVYMMLDSIMRMRKNLSSVRDNPGNEIGRKLSESVPTEEEFNLYDEILPILRRICDNSESLLADKKSASTRSLLTSMASMFGHKNRLTLKLCLQLLKCFI